MLAHEDLGEIEHFTKRRLENGFWWWSDEVVAEEVASSGDGDFILVRGHWTSAQLGRTDVAELLASARRNLSEFERELDLISGRYLIMLAVGGRSYIYQDMLGARTVYYSQTLRVATSHLKIIESLGEHEALRVEPGTAVMSWTADFTPLKGVWNLLANFRLHLESFDVTRFYPVGENPYFDLDRENKYQEITRIFEVTLAEHFALSRPTTFALSGGIDSRLILAMIKPYWDRVQAYTYGLPRADKRNTEVDETGSFFRRTMQSDDRIVRELLDYAPTLSHRFINVSRTFRVDDSLREILSKNTYGNHGPRLVATYRKEFPNGDFLNLRGNGLELSRLGHNEISFDRLESICQRHLPVPVESRLRMLGYDRDTHGYSKHLLAYWEFRHSKWLGEIHNELDAAFDTWSPAGVRRLRDLMGSFPAEELRNGLVVRDLIDRVAPEFNFPAINTRGNLYTEWRRMKLRSEMGQVQSVELELNGQSPVKLRSGQACFPPSGLAQGSLLRIAVMEAQEPGTASFRVRVPYENPKAHGYFDWAIQVNGETFFTLDGAAPSLPINFSVDHLKEGDRIDICMRFHKNVGESQSWSEATQVIVTNLDFLSRKPSELAPVVRNDWI